MRILGIESSCDETAAAVLDGDARLLSNIVASQIPVHAKYGGVVPELASRNHVLAVIPTIEQALAEAGTELAELDAIAVTQGPGLVGSLLIGLQTAKTLAWVHDLPLVGVDHVEAHIHAIFLVDDDLLPADAPRPKPPYLALAVSGGHTSLYRVGEGGSIELVAHTVDDAAGEAFDKVAKFVGLPYPGGVVIDEMSERGDRSAFAFPRPLKRRDQRFFSFSGLKTAARLAIEAVGRPLTEQELSDLAASFQESVVELLVRKTMQAAAALELDQLVIAGGVAANRRLRQAFADACSNAGVRFFPTPPAYCTDNAAMIASLGLRKFRHGEALVSEERFHMDAYPNRRLPMPKTR